MNTSTEYPQILVDTPAVTVVRTSEVQLDAMRVANEPWNPLELPDPQELMIGTGLTFSPFTLEDLDEDFEWFKSVAIKEDE